jgi:putative FmdB family regulatory protein
MPIYEYRCENCRHEMEKIQRFSDAPLTDCPSCGKPNLKKLMSTAAFQLKGAGWYETDFKHSKKDKTSTSLPDTSDTSDSPVDTPVVTAAVSADSKPATESKKTATQAE